MWIKRFVNKLRNIQNITPVVKPICYIRAYRPKGHPKGEKFLMRIPVGGTIPKGVIIGKGTVFDIEL